MTADLKAARAHLQEAVDRPRTFFNYTDTTDAVRTLLTALDQAAEALRPFACMAKITDGPFGPRQPTPDDRPYSGGGAWREADGTVGTITFGSLRRAATVYATLKPEGEG